MAYNYNFAFTGTIQKWTVPYSGTYKIEAYGAQGGSVGTAVPYLHQGGKGAYVSGEFNLKVGDILYILVGGAGVSKGWNDWGGGGGGGTYVAIGATTTTYKLLAGFNQCVSPLIVAAGGGGAGDDGCNIVGNGQTLAGYGGVGRANTTTEGTSSGSASGSGAGFVTNGICARGIVAFSFLNGGNAGLSAYNGYNGGFGCGGQPYDGGGGGGGWHGGESPSNNTGMGGYSYNSGLNPQGTDGYQSGNGQVTITLLYGAYAFFLEKDDKYYLPIAKYYNAPANAFNPVSLSDIENEITSNPANVTIYNICNSFTVGSKTIKPTNIIDISLYRICIISFHSVINQQLNKLNLSYIPTNVSLSKTTIKIKEQYTPFTDNIFNPYIDITASDKTNITYNIDYEYKNDITDSNASLLYQEHLKDDFYLSFKLNSPASLLKSVTLYNRDINNYSKIKDYDLDINNDYIDTKVTLKYAYKEILINRITKQSFKYCNDTLDKF